MAIASGGTLGVTGHSTSASSVTHTTTTSSLAANDEATLRVVTDNIATADGASNTHTSVTGGTGQWLKIGEYTNSPGGVAGDGVTVSLWKFKATGTNGTGTVFTINFSANVGDKAITAWKWTVASGNILKLTTGTTNPITSEVTAANGFGSSAFSALASLARLWLRACGKEANSTTDITVSTSFTTMAGTRSRNNASAVIDRGEYRLNTSTGETSNPTLAVSGDTAGLFAAFDEVSSAQAVAGVALSSTFSPFAPSLFQNVLGAALASTFVAFSPSVAQAVTSATVGSTFAAYAPTVATSGSGLAVSLTSFWPLNESSGNAVDVHGSNTLTDNNTVGAATGSRDFESSNSEYFSHATNADFEPGNTNFSFAGWIKLESYGDKQILAKDAVGNRDFTMDISGDHLRFYIDGGGPSGITGVGVDLTVLSTGVWYFVAGGYNSTSNLSWASVDANTPSTDSCEAVTPPVTSAQFRIGAREYTSFEGYFDGEMKLFGYWKRDIRSDLTTLHNGGTPLEYADIVGGGGGDQAVTGVACASTFAAYTPTIAPGAVTVAGATVASTFQARVPTIAPGAVTVSGATVASTFAAYAPTLRYNVTTSHLPSTFTAYAPTIAPGAVTVSMPTLTSTFAANAPTVAVGAVAVTGATVGSSFAAYAPTISAGGTTISGVSVPSTFGIFAPTITVGAVSLSGGSVSSTFTAFSPTVAAAISSATLGSSFAAYSPSVGYGVAGASVASTFSAFAPTLAQGITTAHVSSTFVARVPTVAPGAVAISGASVASTFAANPPTVVGAGALAGATVGSTFAAYAPTIAAGPVSVTTAHVASTFAARVPSVGYGVAGATVPSTFTPFTPSLTTLTALTGAHVPSTFIASAPSLSYTTIAGTVASTFAAFAPSIRHEPQVAHVSSTFTAFAPMVAVDAALVEGASVASTFAAFAPRVSRSSDEVAPDSITVGAATFRRVVTTSGAFFHRTVTAPGNISTSATTGDGSIRRSVTAPGSIRTVITSGEGER
jgi:hypothetical protein